MILMSHQNKHFRNMRLLRRMYLVEYLFFLKI